MSSVWTILRLRSTIDGRNNVFVFLRPDPLLATGLFEHYEPMLRYLGIETLAPHFDGWVAGHIKRLVGREITRKVPRLGPTHRSGIFAKEIEAAHVIVPTLEEGEFDAVNLEQIQHALL